MPFRSYREALAQRVQKLEDDVRSRDDEIGRLRRARPHRSERRLRRLVAVLAVAVVGLGVVVGQVALRPIAEALAGPAEVERWRPNDAPEAPLLVDVNDDGREDVVGVYESSDRVVLGALDGERFTPLWEVPLDPERAPRHVALSDDHLFVSEGSELFVHALEDGEVVRTVRLVEPVREICARHDRRGPVWVRGRDHHHRVGVSGEPEPSLRPGWCDPHQVTDAPRIDGVEADTALLDGRHVVAFGREAGRPAVYGFRLGDRQARWAHSLRPDSGAVVPGRHAVLHEGQLLLAQSVDDEVVLQALEAAGGHERWRAELEAGALRRVVAGRDRWAVLHGDRLSLLDAGGRRLVTLGR